MTRWMNNGQSWTLKVGWLMVFNTTFNKISVISWRCRRH